MSMNKIDKKFNKRKNKKKKEMFLEDYAKENNINLNLSINYGSSPEKTNKSDTQSNSQDSNKFDDYDINKNNIKSNLNYKKHYSASTNNSSTDDDIKEKEKSENKFKKAFMKNKIINSINNGVKEFQLNDKSYDYNNNNNNDYYNMYNARNNFNKRLFNGVKQYYTNIGENNNNNYNNIDNIQANIYLRNYQNACLSNYLNNMTMKIYCYNNSIYKFNLNTCLQKIKENEKTLDNLKNQITLLENQTLHDMILSSQMTNLINYIKKKTNISNIDNNNIKFCNNQLKHPYFYTNHNEEIRVKFILYLIEGLFFEEHLTQDYTLLNLLDRDGYASLTQLEKHPQLVYSKISLDNLRTVFLEHRQNEVTETVETFDDILIRNKDWRNIKKKGKLEKKKIEQNLLNEMGKIKLAKIQNLMGRKSELIQIQDKLYFRYHVMTQQIKQFQSHFNKINNFYNYQTNIFKNNSVYNVYSNNNNQKKFGY